MTQEFLLSSFYIWADWGTGSLCHLSKDPQLGRVRTFLVPTGIQDPWTKFLDIKWPWMSQNCNGRVGSFWKVDPGFFGVQMSSRPHVGLGCRCSGRRCSWRVSDMLRKPSWPRLSSSCGGYELRPSGHARPRAVPRRPWKGPRRRTRRLVPFPCALPGGPPLDRCWKESKNVPAEWVLGNHPIFQMSKQAPRGELSGSEPHSTSRDSGRESQVLLHTEPPGHNQLCPWASHLTSLPQFLPL